MDQRIAESVRYLAFAAVQLAAVSAGAQSFYQIGNSLTVDSNPSAIAAMAESVGLNVEGGFHIRTGSNLTQIWNAPGESYFATSEPHGRFRNALANYGWDHLVLQAFYNGEPLSRDVAQFQQFRDLARENPASADAKLFVYAPWPLQDDWGNYEQTAPEPNLVHRQQTFYQLVDQLNAAETQNEWMLIPVGDVFNEVRRRIARDGTFAGLTSVSGLYRDIIHASPAGQFLAATTIFSTVFQTSPIGVPVPRSTSDAWTTQQISDEFALEAQKLVWDIVSEQWRTGVGPYGDANRDTIIDSSDLTAIHSAMGARSAITADATADGVVDLEDLERWAEALTLDEADFNGDGFRGIVDHRFMSQAYGSIGPSPLDMNGDRRVDAADYTLWRDAADLYNSADFNQDGLVTTTDYAVWRAEQGWRERLPEDVNRDGVVDAADYTVWRDDFDATAQAAGQVVPEPYGATLLALALGSLLRVRVVRRAADAPLVPVERVA